MNEAPRIPLLNRELSWIEFNGRVLRQAARVDVPLLDRFFFLSVVASNFDEFFMVRVAAARRHDQEVASAATRDLVREIDTRVRAAVVQQYRILAEQIRPGLRGEGLQLVRGDQYSMQDLRVTQRDFEREIFPTLTPVRFSDGGYSGVVANLRLSVAFRLREPQRKQEVVAVVQLPAGVSRLRSLPARDGQTRFAVLEDLIINGAAQLFPGCSVVETLEFRVTRDADLEVDEARDEDFFAAMEEVLVDRRSSVPVRLEVAPGSPELRRSLQAAFDCSDAQVYELDGPLDLAGLREVREVPGFEALRYPPWVPAASPALPLDSDLWERLRQTDVLLHRPFESFEPVVRLIARAAEDPDVMAIKMTLYRTERGSPIVDALERAARGGKQVTVVVELKARFDEAKNIDWAHRLGRAGAIVVFGIVDLKVHAKALLIVRREESGIRRYVHFSTGNYNSVTARAYTDLCLLSSRDELAQEATVFFNAITGYSATPRMTRLAMAPTALKRRLIGMIEREALRDPAEQRLIIAKVNSLSDPEVVAALYRASQAGVDIQLNVRGVCTLVPGVPDVSDNIKVHSVVGRFLEHSRIFYFCNGGADEVYLASADWMPRNLERRVELMVAVEQDDLRERLLAILRQGLRDTVHASRLLADGSYEPLDSGVESFDSQEWFCGEARRLAQAATGGPVRELQVRRSVSEPRPTSVRHRRATHRDTGDG